MTARHRPHFRPNLVELESRVVPAWWAVTAPTPASGTPGDTDATHSGELTFRSDYTPDAAGTVTVWADSPTAAAVAALAGTITVTLGDEEPTDIVFDADTVGTIADHKAFAVSESGGVVSIAFEDMAGWNGCDYDYNDRSWGGVTVASASDPVVDIGSPSSWLWEGPKYPMPEGNATVSLAVTRPDADTFHWAYTVRNNTMSTLFDSPGLFQFSLGGAAGGAARNLASSLGWSGTISGSGLFWEAPSKNSGPFVAKGKEATLSFDTPPAPAVAGSGAARAAPVVDAPPGDPEGGGWEQVGTALAGGDAKVPGEVKVVITYADSTEVTDKGGLRVAKLEKAFYKVPNEDKFELVKDPVATDKYRDFIDDDPDRFYVWVYEPAKWAKTDAAGTPSEPRLQTGITTLARADADKPEVVRDDLTMVDCLRFNTAPGGAAGTGWYRSDSQILMSNKKDDDYFHKKFPKVLAVDNTPPGDLALVKADGQYKVSDRTHLARLGDVVVSKYEVAPNAFASSKDYRVPVRSYVKVVFTSLYDSHKSLIVSESAATKLIDAANEQYAQVGILLLMKYRKAPVVIKNVNGVVGQSVDLYNGFDGPIYNDDPDKTKLVKDKLYLPETRAVLDNTDLRTPETDDIEVFFVNSVISRNGPEPVRIAGCAIAKANAIAPENCNVVFISVSALKGDSLVGGKPFTLPHEIGHILTNAGHYIGEHKPINLMRDGGTSTNQEIGYSKRLFEFQDKQIRDASPELLFDSKPMWK